MVIPTFRRAPFLPQILAPLLADPGVMEIIVVVDGSPDDSIELLERMTLDDPRLRSHWQENAGAGAARQAGLELARGEVVLLLDDDVLAGPGLGSGHAAAAQAYPGCAIVGYMPVAPAIIRTSDSVTTELYAREYEQQCRDYLERPDAVLEHLWMGNVSLPRTVGLAVGLGDPGLVDLFPFEDREVGLRLHAAGVPAVFLPSLQAAHLHRRPIDRFRDDARRQGVALQVMFDRHPDAVAAPTPEALHGWLPLPVRLLLDLVYRQPDLGLPLSAVLAQATRSAGGLQLWRLQRRLLLLVRHVAQAQGAGSAAQPRTGARG